MEYKICDCSITIETFPDSRCMIIVHEESTRQFFGTLRFITRDGLCESDFAMLWTWRVLLRVVPNASDSANLMGLEIALSESSARVQQNFRNLLCSEMHDFVMIKTAWLHDSHDEPHLGSGGYQSASLPFMSPRNSIIGRSSRSRLQESPQHEFWLGDILSAEATSSPILVGLQDARLRAAAQVLS